MPPTPPSGAGEGPEDATPGWQAHGRPVPHPRQAADSAAFFQDAEDNPEATAPLPPYMSRPVDGPAENPWSAPSPWAPAPPPAAGRGDGFYDYGDDDWETEQFGDPREQRSAVVDLAAWSGLTPANTAPPEATQAISLADDPGATQASGIVPPAEFAPLSAPETDGGTPPEPENPGRRIGGLQPITPGVRPGTRPFVPSQGGSGAETPSGPVDEQQVPAQSRKSASYESASVAPAAGDPDRPAQGPWSRAPYLPEVPPIPDTARSPWSPFGGSTPVTSTEPQVDGASAPGAEETQATGWPIAPRTAPEPAIAALNGAPAQTDDTVRTDVPAQSRGADTTAGVIDAEPGPARHTWQPVPPQPSTPAAAGPVQPGFRARTTDPEGVRRERADEGDHFGPAVDEERPGRGDGVEGAGRAGAHEHAPVSARDQAGAQGTAEAGGRGETHSAAEVVEVPGAAGQSAVEVSDGLGHTADQGWEDARDHAAARGRSDDHGLAVDSGPADRDLQASGGVAGFDGAAEHVPAGDEAPPPRELPPTPEVDVRSGDAATHGPSAAMPAVEIHLAALQSTAAAATTAANETAVEAERADAERQVESLHRVETRAFVQTPEAAENESLVETEPMLAAQSAVDAEPAPGTDLPVKTGPSADTAPAADTALAADSELTADTELAANSELAAKTGTTGVSEPATDIKPTADIKPDTGSERAMDTAQVADAAPAADAALIADTEPASGIEPGASIELISDNEPGAVTEPGVGPAPSADTGPSAATDLDADIRPDAGTEASADIRPSVRAEALAETSPLGILDGQAEEAASDAGLDLDADLSGSQPAHPAPVWVTTTRLQPVDLPIGRGETDALTERTDEQPVVDADPETPPARVDDRRAAAVEVHRADETPDEVIVAIVEALRERTGAHALGSDAAQDRNETTPAVGAAAETLHEIDASAAATASAATGERRSADTVVDRPAGSGGIGLSSERSAEIGAAVAALRSGARKAGSIVYTPAASARRHIIVPATDTPDADAVDADATPSKPNATDAALVTVEPAGAAVRDASPADTDSPDTEPVAADVSNATLGSADTLNAEPADADAQDASPADTDWLDAEPASADLRDVSPAAADPRDAEPADTSLTEVSPASADLRIAGSADTDFLDVSPVSTDWLDTKPADAAVPASVDSRDTEPADIDTLDAEPVAAEDPPITDASDAGLVGTQTEPAETGLHQPETATEPDNADTDLPGTDLAGTGAATPESVDPGLEIEASAAFETAGTGEQADVGSGDPQDAVRKTWARTPVEPPVTGGWAGTNGGSAPPTDEHDLDATSTNAGPDEPAPTSGSSSDPAAGATDFTEDTTAETKADTEAELTDDEDAGVPLGALAGSDAGAPGAVREPARTGPIDDRASDQPERDHDDDFGDDDVTLLSTNLDRDDDHPASGALDPEAPQLRPGDVVETPIAVWTDEAAAPFRQQWHEIKAQFVDDPVGALAQAQTVCANAVHDLADSLLAEQAGLDPHKANATPDTESMRIAMRRYREFLDRILAL